MTIYAYERSYKNCSKHTGGIQLYPTASAADVRLQDTPLGTTLVGLVTLEIVLLTSIAGAVPEGGGG